MWDTYEDDDSFEKMAKAKVTFISSYHRCVEDSFLFQSLLTNTKDGVWEGHMFLYAYFYF